MSTAPPSRKLGTIVLLAVALGALGAAVVVSRRFLAQRPAAPALAPMKAAASPAPPQKAEEATFQVASATGTVEAQRAGQWLPIKNGDTLTRNDVVRTAPGARAVLRLSAGTEIELRERVEIGLDRLPSGATVDLRRGKVVAHVSGAEGLEITSRDTRTANEGPAHFVVLSDERGRVSVAALSGKAKFTAGGKALTVPEGTETSAEAGAAPRRRDDRDLGPCRPLLGRDRQRRPRAGGDRRSLHGHRAAANRQEPGRRRGRGPGRPDPTGGGHRGAPPPTAGAETGDHRPVEEMTGNDSSEEEIRRLRDLLAAAGRLAEFGRFAAQQIHELRQPLFAIKGLAQLLLEKDRVELDEVLDFARHIVEQSERLTGLVANLRQLSVPAQVAGKARTEVGAVLVRVTSLLEFRLRKAGITLRTQIAPDVPPVAVAPHALEQILINLLANALDAVSATPGPIVQLRARVVAENPRFAAIEVADNGPGIAKAIRARLFESFFSTKGEEQGTGLGLAVSREIARGAGGDLALLEDPGTWNEPAVTVFRLTLPVSQEL
jgi:signal transduction histidine kinase